MARGRCRASLHIEIQEDVVMFTISRREDGEWEEVEIKFNYWGCGLAVIGALTGLAAVAWIVFSI